MIKALATALTWHEQQAEESGISYEVSFRTKSGQEYYPIEIHPFTLEDTEIILQLKIEGEEEKVANLFLGVSEIESFLIVV